MIDIYDLTAKYGTELIMEIDGGNFKFEINISGTTLDARDIPCVVEIKKKLHMYLYLLPRSILNNFFSTVQLPPHPDIE